MGREILNLDVLLQQDEGEASEKLLLEAIQQGALIISDVAASEISVHFSHLSDCFRFLEECQINFESLNQEACYLAGQIWKSYRSKGGKRDKMIPDFMVAAHAFTQCDRLLTRDRGFYRTYFPKLKILS